ncbi:hypothetical protein EYF80_058242 [Liparis tanakae]|uniref:Uncharacterized protein n=1 Tax=Liparis tanakae TaxID=230148 RepID=A0A4Z2ERR4_9TELE|nr:hypothetical protein EYF80_058242 [Liparis tanakae]
MTIINQNQSIDHGDVPSDSSGGGHNMSEPNSQERRRDAPFSTTPRAPFLFRDRCEMCACASESASRPALPLPPLCVDEDEEEVEPKWAGPKWEGRLIQCSMPDMSSPGPASSSEPDDESEHRGDRPGERGASITTTSHNSLESLMKRQE